MDAGYRRPGIANGDSYEILLSLDIDNAVDAGIFGSLADTAYLKAFQSIAAAGRSFSQDNFLRIRLF